MSVHKSLKFDSAASSSRSVLTRRERLEKLATEGKWDEETSVYGLPKVRTKFKILTAKQKKAASAAAKQEEGAAEEAPAEESAE